jgi:RHS repeat-associated protein
VPTTTNGSAFYYEYTIKDHLGNARVSFRANGAAVSVIQENHYYAFGMEMEGAWAAQAGVKNNYEYNGKELNEDFGLNLSDYGARWYDAAIGRWWSVDPKTAFQSNISGYNYVNNNPIGRIDPDGMQDETSMTNAEWIEKSRPGNVWTANNKELAKNDKKNSSKTTQELVDAAWQKTKDGTKKRYGTDNGKMYELIPFGTRIMCRGAVIADYEEGVRVGATYYYYYTDAQYAADRLQNSRNYGPWTPEVMGIGASVSINFGFISASLSGGFAGGRTESGMYGGFSLNTNSSWGFSQNASLDWFMGDTYGNPDGSDLRQIAGEDIVTSMTLGSYSFSRSITANRNIRGGWSQSKSGLETFGVSIGYGKGFSFAKGLSGSSGNGSIGFSKSGIIKF